MIATERSVQVQSFRVIEANFEYIASDSEDEVFPDHDYDINVEHQISEVEEGILALTMSISVNWDDEPELGYSMYVLGVMIFKVLDYGGQDEDFSFESNVKEAVQLGIASIRGYLANLTTFGIMGPYVLPNISLDELEDTDRREGVRTLNPNKR